METAIAAAAMADSTMATVMVAATITADSIAIPTTIAAAATAEETSAVCQGHPKTAVIPRLMDYAATAP